MQADAEVTHGQESHRQHQRNRDAHHQPRSHVDVITFPPGVLARSPVKTQRNKTHRQHNHHGLDQHAYEFIDRVGHRCGLILNLYQLDTGRQAGTEACGGDFQGFTQGDDVPTLGHGNTQRNHFTALMPHLDRRWIHIAALDLGDVAQAQLTAGVAAYRHGT